MTAPRGPYGHEVDAIEDARDVLDMPARGPWRQANARKLLSACQAAGVEVGTYDQRIIDWLGGYEPQVVQVVVGLISRAHAAGCQRRRTRR